MNLVPIGELVEKVDKLDPRSDFGDGQFTYVDIGSVSQKTKRIEGPQTIPCEDAPSRARQVIAVDDVLVSTVRPNLNAVAQVPTEYDGTIASTGFTVLRPKAKELDSSYLYHWVRTGDFVNKMMLLATGQSYPAVSDKIVKSSKIPLPPMEEQKRIAGILDQADTLRRLRTCALKKLNSLGQAIFYEMFGDPTKNHDLSKLPFEELLEGIDSGVSPKCLDRSAANGEFGILKLSAVTSGVFKPEENKCVSESYVPDPRHEVQRGDLLFTRKNTRALVAAVALVRDTPKGLFLPDLVFRFRLRNTAPVDPTYLHALLSFPAKRREVQSLAGGSAGSMPNISKGKLLKCQIELPSIEDQKGFAKRIEMVETAKSPLQEGISQAEELFRSLQYRAFRGDL